MKLDDCTKEELLWVIRQAQKRSRGSINYYIDHALSDLLYHRAQDTLSRAEALSNEADQAMNEVAELLRPYEGKRMQDIPQEVLTQVERAVQQGNRANLEFLEIMRGADRL